MQLAQAQALAENVAQLLEPACERIVIAGSIRRGKPDVKDIEIVAEGRVEALWSTSLFGENEPTYADCLAERVSELLQQGALRLDTQLKRNGAKYKRFMLPEGIACDLFVASTANFGNILAIRTGNADFSKALVTPRRHGGLMPGGLAQRDGCLWHGDELVRCATEEAFFRALGLDWIEPARRTAEVVPMLLRGVGEAR